MSDIVIGIVRPVIEAVKWVGAPILRQFKSLCCFKPNIKNLIKEAEKLQVIEKDLHEKVDAARNDVRLIFSEVETWLRDSKEIKDEKDEIINEVPNVEGGCLKLRARFSLSKRAVKTTDRLKELQNQYKFSDNCISKPGPPPATKAVPFKRTCEFKSRKKIEEDIMTTLRGEDVNMMGIYGMGGLGKTTMAKRIWNRVLKEHVFEEVVMAVVGQHTDRLKIQLEIGRSLGLNLEGESLQGTVLKLHARLSGTKRTLIILDDVWESFEPVDIGIPTYYKGCTILLTSRNHDVLGAMNVENIFVMELLSEEDSWFLFKEKVGTCVDDTQLNSIAKEFVNKCKGLPIALITVGYALKNNVDVSFWENALQQLKMSDPYILDFTKNVYYPLELSYNVLERKYQYVLLLCCLYPEDADIPLEHLTYFCMGLCIFGRGIGDVKEGRNRICALMKVLKSRSLLLDSKKGDDYVRMHGVIRDVCIYIARKKRYISDGNCIGNSSLQRYEFDSGFGLLQIRNSSDKEIKFYEIRDLYVLLIENCSLTSLPFTQRLNNLITLVLDSCWGLKTFSTVGELVNLEILICRDCNLIEELPPEIKGLNRLKVLDLTGCRKLKRIGGGIISSLVQMEELKMLESDDRILSNSFPNLKILKLNDLPALKQLWKSSQNDLGNDFLPQLKVLEIRNCEMMEVVFLWKGEDEKENNSCHHITKVFPKLKELELVGLPNLISFCQGIEDIEFPLLSRIEINECGKMKGMVSNENDSGGSSSNASIHGLFCPQKEEEKKKKNGQGTMEEQN